MLKKIFKNLLLLAVVASLAYFVYTCLRIINELEAKVAAAETKSKVVPMVTKPKLPSYLPIPPIERHQE